MSGEKGSVVDGDTHRVPEDALVGSPFLRIGSTGCQRRTRTPHRPGNNRLSFRWSIWHRFGWYRDGESNLGFRDENPASCLWTIAAGVLLLLPWVERGESNPLAPAPQAGGAPRCLRSTWWTPQDSNLLPPPCERGAPPVKLGVAVMVPVARLDVPSPVWNHRHGPHPRNRTSLNRLIRAMPSTR